MPRAQPGRGEFTPCAMLEPTYSFIQVKLFKDQLSQALCSSQGIQLGTGWRPDSHAPCLTFVCLFIPHRSQSPRVDCSAFPQPPSPMLLLLNIFDSLVIRLLQSTTMSWNMLGTIYEISVNLGIAILPDRGIHFEIEMDSRSKCKNRNYKTPRGKLGKTHSDINHSKIFYGPPPRVMEIKAKINKWDPLNIKAFAQQRKI